jgi:NAD-reducing hydrogenase large subunit
MESDPAGRNLFGLIAKEPELARSGIRLRQFGQQIIAMLGGQRIHPAWAVAGGVRAPLTVADRDRIRARVPEARDATLAALARFKKLRHDYREEVNTFGNFPTLFMGLIGPDDTWEHYDGRIRFVDSEGQIVADGLDPARYRDFLGEATESWSYLKSPYYRPLGYPDGVYRVGPLARLNLCAQLGTPLADREFADFREGGHAVTSSFLYHQARLIEILTSIERIGQMLDDPDLLSDRLRARAGINQREGVGCSEAPRGTLFHHYQVDRDGKIDKANLLIATGQNNLAMNQTVAQIAQHYIKQGPDIPEGLLNRVEAGIRAFDPCLSCSTHAAGTMPLHVQVVGPDGEVLNEVWRN